MNILAILPTYNEALNIELILSQLLDMSKSIKKSTLEILVVDDNSPDGTAKIVKRMMKRNKNISIISGDKNGLGEAYIRGIKHGLKAHDPDYILMMDSDSSHDPYTVPSMVKHAESGADLVIGSRYTTNGFIPGNWPIVRVINSRVASRLTYMLTGISKDIKDLTSGFRLVKVSKLRSININGIQTKGYGFLIHILYLLVGKGADVREVPIVFRERMHGSSKLRLKDITEFIRCVYMLNPTSTPRKIIRFAKVGIVGAFVNLGILYILKSYTHLPLILCALIAIEISILSNYFMHTFYTFKDNHTDKDTTRFAGIKRFLSYNIASAATALLTLAIFELLSVYAGLYFLVAQFIAICIAFVANYLVSNKYVWGDSAIS